jgi:dynein heavy chain 1
MVYRSTHVATLALIKRHPTLDPLQPIGDQIHFLNLFGPAASLDSSVANGDGSPASSTIKSNPYESLHSLVHLAVAPYFEAYVNSRAGKKLAQEASSKSKDADAKMGIPMTKKKFAELELSLLHLQQNVEIPDIHLVIHPVVQRTVDRCRAEGTRVGPEAVDPIFLSDSTFLNKLQGDVNSWIKEIQNVTKLNRNVASGTASQEINFWLSMEKALEDIEDQLRSEPIVLTLDILKHAKRFHATVSFIADTGLKEATDIGPFSLCHSDCYISLKLIIAAFAYLQCTSIISS